MGQEFAIAHPQPEAAHAELLEHGARDLKHFDVGQGALRPGDVGVALTVPGPGSTNASTGLVDAHTHPVFSGWRADEFELRTSGATYVEISEQGGGILSTVRGVREASKEELLALLLLRLDRFLDH